MRDPILEAYDAGKPIPRRRPPPPDLEPAPVPEWSDPWPDAPFTPLGANGDTHWFFNAAGEIVSRSLRALGQWQDILGLCGGDTEWLSTHWPAFDRDGNPTDDFQARGVASAVMKRCLEMPAFDPNEPRRRYGLWRVPDGWALHLGKVVLWCGKELRAGFSRDGALWPAMAPRPAPALPCGVEVVLELQSLLARWNWDHPDAPAVILGLTVNGMLGGLASWRAHGFVIGEAGAGKTTLLRFLASLCPLTLYRNDFTEAGVRQVLAETAASVILDEAEGDDHGDAKLKRVIEMLRRASSGQGVAGVRGSPEQAARSFTVTASAIMGAIHAPPLPPQDATRFTVLQLRPLPQGSQPAEADCNAFIAEHGLALWGRAVASGERIVALFELFRERLVADGCTRRAGDQLGIIAACHWAMTTDPEQDPTAENPAALTAALAPVRWLIEPASEGELDSNGNQALQRLLATPLDTAGDRWLLGQALSRYRELGHQLATMSADLPERGSVQGEQVKLDQILQAHGVRWATWPLKAEPGAPAPPVGLYIVAGSHPRLLRAFDGTPWAGQRWAAAIAQLPESQGGRGAHPVRMGGGKMRACWVSQKTLDRLTRDD